MVDLSLIPDAKTLDDQITAVIQGHKQYDQNPSEEAEESRDAARRELAASSRGLNKYIEHKLLSLEKDYERCRKVHRRLKELNPDASYFEHFVVSGLADAKMIGDNDLINLSRQSLRVLATLERKDTNFAEQLRQTESTIDTVLAEIPDLRMKKIADGHGKAAQMVTAQSTSPPTR